MKAVQGIIALALLVAGTLLLLHLASRRKSAGPLVHVENGFEFTVHAPYEKVFPLFGADGERTWAGDNWNPQFVYPLPAQDIEGEVFTVAHGHTHSTWVNTAFDQPSGHIQYTYVIPGAQAVRIDIHLSHTEPSSTGVKVVYERTALSADFNAHLNKIHEGSETAKEWQSSIEKCLGVSRSK
jgi:hypothetical protein